MSRSVAAGETYTVESGTNSYNDGINLGGEINVSGEVFMTDIVDDRSAAGVGTATATTAAAPVYFSAATGLGQATGIAQGNTGVFYASAPGSGSAIGAATSHRDRDDAAASGVGGATGTAVGTIAITASASGSGSGGGVVEVESTVAPGSEYTIPSGTSEDVAGLNLGGEGNIAGELNITEGSGRALRVRYSAGSGTGTSIGTATADQMRYSTASGVGSATGTAVAAPLRDASASGVGTATGSATAFQVAYSSAAGVGGSIGVATAVPTRYSEASGSGSAAGRATYTIVYPMIRRDRATMAYDERDEFDLGGDPYDTE